MDPPHDGKFTHCTYANATLITDVFVSGTTSKFIGAAGRVNQKRMCGRRSVPCDEERSGGAGVPVAMS